MVVVTLILKLLAHEDILLMNGIAFTEGLGKTNVDLNVPVTPDGGGDGTTGGGTNAGGSNAGGSGTTGTEGSGTQGAGGSGTTGDQGTSGGNTGSEGGGDDNVSL